MKFSVLLPTRNRLEYLKYAVFSVQQQDYENWEIVVSDNASEEDIEGFISSLGDSRIHYFRTQSFCPVTENWNNALDHSTGDYVVMLGDDDCLLDGYFSTCASLISQYQLPDMIYNSAFIYVYPGVAPNIPEGRLTQYGYAPFLVHAETPSLLDKEEAQRLVKEIMNFNVSVHFNMQHSLVGRKLILEMQKHGKFYQSPYPDYYATTALLLKAERILTVPFPMVVIGVTPKSFGYYYINNKEKEGSHFLDGGLRRKEDDAVSKYILSGTEMNISWLFAMEAVKNNFGDAFDLKVNYRKFRFLQMMHQYKKFACREEIDMIGFWRQLFLWEKLVYLFPFPIALLMRCLPHPKGKSLVMRMAYAFSHPSHGKAKPVAGAFKNVMDVFEQIKIEALK